MNRVQRVPTVPRMRRWRLGWPEPFDVLVVAGLAAFYLAPAAAPRAADIEWPVALRVAVTLLRLLWRAQAPVLVLSSIIVLCWALLVPDGGVRLAGGTVVVMALAVALGAVASRRPVWVSLIALAVTAASMALFLQAAAFPGNDYFGWFFTTSFVLCWVVWGIGFSAHRNRQRIQDLEAEQQQALDAVTAERRQIATELNSIITSAATTMRDEAAAAAAQLRGDLERASRALATIEETGIEAMHELRRLLHLLHDDPGFASAEPTNLAPAARLSTRLGDIGNGDAGVTVAVIAATMLMIAGGYGGAGLFASLFLGIVLIGLLWRNHFPVVVLTVVIAGHAAAVFLFFSGDFGDDNQTALPGVLVALAAVASNRAWWISLPCLAIAWTYISLPFLRYPYLHATSLLSYAVVVTAVWLAAAVVGRRRRQIDALVAAQQATREAVDRERAALAYELHDVIGHSITIMVIQAAGARRMLTLDTSRAAEALGHIDDAGKAAIGELRELLALLGTDPDDQDPPPDPPGITQVGVLIERTRRIIPNTTLQVIGTPRRLERSVDAAAYCVVRQALANAVKHSAHDAQIVLTVTWTPQTLRLSADNRPGSAGQDPPLPVNGGYGLLSLRERVNVVGGTIQWAPDHTGFHLDATLPAIPSTTHSANQPG